MTSSSENSCIDANNGVQSEKDSDNSSSEDDECVSQQRHWTMDADNTKKN